MAGNCRQCGAALVHFENPDRDICVNDHSKLAENQARAKTARDTAPQRRGQKRTPAQRRKMSDAASKREKRKRDGK